ncbi:D-2-hydroxyacid dehydrogenase [Streptomyces sp. NPDC047000]|uniref:D-2-hydroxyacid dehydrogenase n=1 Tax=Streptomyces sp. NPDC047000 TaxID=3155474 RepID=UPI00340ECAA6
MERDAGLRLFGLPPRAGERVAALWPGPLTDGGPGDRAASGPCAGALLWRGDDAEVAAFLADRPECRWLHTTAVGVPPAVLRHAARTGLTVTNGAGTHGSAVAEHVLAVLLAHLKALPRTLAAQRERTWEVPVAAELRGRRAGVLGLGDIGRRTARLLDAFGARVTGFRRGTAGRPDSEDVLPGLRTVHGRERLAEFLHGLDVLVVAVPLTEETAGLVGTAELALLRPGAVLVNVGRGPVVDEAALVAALRGGRLGGAALDVFAAEPLPPSSPLWSEPGVLITPHSADATAGTDERCLDLLLDNVIRFRAGRPLRNVVDPARGY